MSSFIFDRLLLNPIQKNYDFEHTVYENRSFRSHQNAPTLRLRLRTQHSIYTVNFYIRFYAYKVESHDAVRIRVHIKILFIRTTLLAHTKRPCTIDTPRGSTECVYRDQCITPCNNARVTVRSFFSRFVVGHW